MIFTESNNSSQRHPLNVTKVSSYGNEICLKVKNERCNTICPVYILDRLTRIGYTRHKKMDLLALGNNYSHKKYIHHLI